MEGVHRMRPNFLIIGAQKCGTTSLWTSLREHPGVHVANEKELNFFSDDSEDPFKFPKTVEWYEGNFDPTKDVQFTAEYIPGQTPTGEASPVYLYHPKALHRIRAYDVSMKLIVMLRDPVLRAISHYWWEVRMTNERLPIMEAFLKESERLALDGNGFGGNRRHFAYKDKGIYHILLDRLYALFPTEQIYVCFLADLMADPLGFTHGITDFIGARKWDDYSFEAMLKNEYPTADQEVINHLSEFFAPENVILNQKYGIDISNWI